VKTEVICSSEMSVDFQHTVQRYVAVVSTLNNIIFELGVKQETYLTDAIEIKFALKFSLLIFYTI
jgi:hypothetical protein